MRPFLDDLSAVELRVLARIRLAVTARLAAAAAAHDPGLAEHGSRPFRLALRVPGLPRAFVAKTEGPVTAWAGGETPVQRLPPDLTLFFPSSRDCARVLDGSAGRVFPIPGGWGAARALRYFRAAAASAPRMLRSPDTPAVLRAALLLEAAMSALVETANADPAMAPRLAHAPDGLVVVDAGGGVRRALRKEGGRLRSVRVPEDGQDAVLAFRDPESAVAVLAGKKSAVTALGACEASIRGLVPLVQGLFAVLDRASRYLAVKAEKEAGHGR